MGYGDYAPPSGRHPPKPLTKTQMRKLQQAYATAGDISEQVEEKIKHEQEIAQAEADEMLRLV